MTLTAVEQASLPILPIIIGIAVVLLIIGIAAVLYLRKKNSVPAGLQATPDRVLLICDKGELRAPAAGRVITREEIPDETFSSGYLGEGFGVIPTEEAVHAPCDGVITSVEKMSHGLQMKGNGMELLIQAGIDTLDMRGDGFEMLVKKGERVTVGQPLLSFSREKIEKAGHSDCVVVLVMNASDVGHLQIRA